MTEKKIRAGQRVWVVDCSGRTGGCYAVHSKRHPLWIAVERYAKVVARTPSSDREDVLCEIGRITVEDARRAGMNHAQSEKAADEFTGWIRMLA